jgi:asparagine synthase (glutamine-hydrolysing)
MCGIAGLINPRQAPDGHLPKLKPRSVEALSEGMLGLLTHRGPDETGVLRLAQGFLGCNRLSIVDLEHGQQPMSNETGDIWIVYNGEIYDVARHIADLARRGHRFASRSDTEVLIHLYEEFGDALLDHIDGEYAFCLYDQRRQRFLLARDPFGIRPLYYAETGAGGLLFASEIKPLLWAMADATRLSGLAMAQALEGWTPVPPATCFEGVSQLLPGALGIFSEASPSLQVRRYTRMPKDYTACRREDLAGLLEQAVRRRLQADVPVGVYLSGGLDSAIIASLATRISGHPLDTFSVEFAHPRFDESSDQRLLHRHLGSRHHALRIDAFDIEEHFSAAVMAAESVVFRSALVPMFLLSRLVRDAGLKVVLTGEGADELFGGYDLFRELLILRRWAEQPQSEQIPLLLGQIYQYLPEYSPENLRFLIPYYRRFRDRVAEPFAGHALRWAHLGAAAALFLEPPEPSPTRCALERAFPELAGLDVEEQCRQTEIMTLLHGYLLSSQGDRMASAHSVEQRLPFLDRDVATWAFRQPVGHFIKDMQGKEILYGLFGPQLPEPIAAKRKTPYLAPDAEVFLAGRRQEEWRHCFSRACMEKTGVFNPDAAMAFFRRISANLMAGKPLSRRDNTFFFVLLSAAVLQDRLPSSLVPQALKHLYLPI